MKKIVSAVAISAMVLLACPSSFAGQPFNDGPDNEIWISYSPFSFTNALEITTLAIGSAISGGNVESMSSTGAFCAGYHRKLNNLLSLGGEFVFEHSDYKLKISPSQRTVNSYAALVSAKASWLRREHIALYSRLGAGAALFAENGSVIPTFAFQASPLGFEFGGVNVRGFLEAGFGMSGFVSGGVRFGF